MTARRFVPLALVPLMCAGLLTGRALATPDAQRRPTYAADVAPILISNCMSCHRSGQAAFPLTSYEEARTRASDIATSVAAGRMPPWQAVQGPGYPALQDDARLTEREISTLRNWAATGAPPGDLKRAPLPASFPTGWALGVPDMQLTLPRAVHVAADSGDSYRTVAIPVDVPLSVTAVDYQPGKLSALRHARFFFAPPNVAVTDDDVLPGVEGLFGSGTLENFGPRLLDAARSVMDVGAWAPGLARRQLPGQLSIRVPAGSNLIVQMHMKAGDVDAIEDGRVALYVVRLAAVTHAVMPIEVPPASGFGAIAIPAGEANHAVKDEFTLPVDVEAVGGRGFGHLLARDMTLTAKLPNGSIRGLLRIERWNVDYPATYFFATPIKLPKGTVIRSEIVYDNSAANPRNLFNPPRRIAWGHLPAGEMGSMTLLVMQPVQTDAQTIKDAIAARLKQRLIGR